VPPRDNSLLQTEQLEYPFTYLRGVSSGSVVATPRNAGRSGLYRILYRPYARVSGDGDFGDPLPNSVGQSNVFRIRFERGP
jgi:hypothetical protein